MLNAARFAMWQRINVTDTTIEFRLVGTMATLLAGAMALGQWVYLYGESEFTPIGLASTGGLVAIIAYALSKGSKDHRAFVAANALGVLMYGTAIWVGLSILSNKYVAPLKAMLGEDAEFKTNLIIAAAMGIWLFGAIRQILASVEDGPPRRRNGPAFGIVVEVLACFFLIPSIWIFDSDGRDPLASTVWALSQPKPQEKAEDPRQVRRRIIQNRLTELELQQSTVLARSLAALEPRDENAPNLFALGIAGDVAGDEFPRELNSGLDILGQRFPTSGHTVKLINNLAFVDRYPVASRQNFATAVAGIAERMDRNNDIFILFMTSHGSRAGLYLDMGYLAWGSLTPKTVKAVLDMNGIKNRVIIVSACHSGVFVPALKDDNTAIITAAAADRTSFGCSSEADWTYFGDALFNHGFKTYDNFPEAFNEARSSVTARELREGVAPSLPQIEIGNALPLKFPKLFPSAKIENTALYTPSDSGSD